MPSTLHQLELDVDSFGQVLGPAGLDELLQDIHHGWHARAAVAAIEQQQAGALARAAERRPGANFAVEEVFVGQDFHFFTQLEGLDAWTEDEFIHEKRRDVPDCIVSTGKAPSNSIIVPATKWARVSELNKAA